MYTQILRMEKPESNLYQTVQWNMKSTEQKDAEKERQKKRERKQEENVTQAFHFLVQ